MTTLLEEMPDAQLLAAGERAIQTIDFSPSTDTETGTRRLDLVNICHSVDARSGKLSEEQRTKLKALLGADC